MTRAKKKKGKIRLTAFERSVLNRLKEIPRGQVTSYGKLAKAAGRPKAARAVGNALNKNPWAPRVPCHRVVKSNGQLGGYGGGVKRKQDLLSREGIKVRRGKICDFNKRYLKFEI